MKDFALAQIHCSESELRTRIQHTRLSLLIDIDQTRDTQ